MFHTDLASQVARYVHGRGNGPEYFAESVELLAICHETPSRFAPTCYQPSVCLIFQGRKDVLMGQRSLAVTAGDAVIVSHQLPLLAKVTEASVSKPFVALAMPVDLSLIRELKHEIGDVDASDPPQSALQVDEADAALVASISRLFQLVDRPLDAKVVGPLARREAHYRLLTASHGRTLRQLLEPQSHAERIQRAMTILKRDFARSLSVADLAREAGMSPSSFHQHFKTLTATTPLQFQKSLRLLEARRLLNDGTAGVTEVAFEVGYQSPTQFSREYSRHFGHAPKHDLPSPP